MRCNHKFNLALPEVMTVGYFRGRDSFKVRDFKGSQVMTWYM